MLNQDYPERIHAYMTKTSWLHFEDSLTIGKIKLFAGHYNRRDKPNINMRHYINVDTLRPLLLSMSWGRDIDMTDYKGGDSQNGVISRVLSIKSKEDKIFWQLTHGPGKKTATGAVTPVKVAIEKKTSINIMMKKEDARQIACKLTEYLLAWQTASQIAIYNSPYRHVKEDYAGKSQIDYYRELGLGDIIQS